MIVAGVFVLFILSILVLVCYLAFILFLLRRVVDVGLSIRQVKGL